MRKINIGLIGLGTIGCGVVKLLREHGVLVSQASGIALQLVKVCDKDLSRKREIPIDRTVLTDNPEEIIADARIDIVIELIGGIHPARELIIAALERKKYVVTANKALLAHCGEELFRIARQNGVDIYFEASVCGGIPLIAALREGLIANRIDRIYGIVNGTCNYVLTQMASQGIGFSVALAQAQQLGYAEQDPTLDINGSDAAHKLAVMARLCFQQTVDFEQVYFEGIECITAEDLRYAEELGFAVKLLAIAKRRDRMVELRVHPTLVPQEHVLAHVSGVFNAVFVVGDYVGEQLFYGKGAGQDATASAVVSDLVRSAATIGSPQGVRLIGLNSEVGAAEICPIGQVHTPYYIRFSAEDKPGVLSQVAHIFTEQQISIQSVIQKSKPENNAVPLVMMTHAAEEFRVRAAVDAINTLPAIMGTAVAIRVEPFQERF